MENQEHNTQERLSNLADRLDTLQAEKNDGRGVSTIQIIVSCLRRGAIEEAKAAANTDWDKIRDYEDIQSLLVNELMEGSVG